MSIETSCLSEQENEIECDDKEYEYLRSLPLIASKLQNFLKKEENIKLNKWFIEDSWFNITTWFNYVKKHASESIIKKGRTKIKHAFNCKNFKDVRVVLKIEKTPNDLDLAYERKVYDCLISNFHNLPFFTFPLAITQTTKRDKKLVVTEDCGKDTLRSFLNKKERIDKEVLKALLQMICVLNFMSTKGLVHGDLHFNNIFYTEYSFLTGKKDDYFYFDPDFENPRVIGQSEVTEKTLDGGARQISNNKYVTCKYMIKIYDWDFAYYEKFKDVKDSDFKKEFKELLNIEKISDIYDKLAFLRILYNRNILTYLLPLNNLKRIKKILENDYIERLQYTCINYSYRYSCNNINDDKKKEITEWVENAMKKLHEEILKQLDTTKELFESL